ncbi:unnamed protein product, partial [Ectocarpus sp. 12 AP-2014]
SAPSAREAVGFFLAWSHGQFRRVHPPGLSSINHRRSPESPRQGRLVGDMIESHVAEDDIAPSSRRDEISCDVPLRPHHRWHGLDVQRRLLTRQSPGEPCRRPLAYVLIDHVRHHFKGGSIGQLRTVLAT